MKIWAILLIALLSFASIQAEAQTPRFAEAERVLSYCEQMYNTRIKTKDCACTLEKFKAKEMQMFKEIGSGTVPPLDRVLHLVRDECHIFNASGAKELETCNTNPEVSGLTPAQKNKFCKCRAIAINDSVNIYELASKGAGVFSQQQKNETIKQTRAGAQMSCKKHALK